MLLSRAPVRCLEEISFCVILRDAVLSIFKIVKPAPFELYNFIFKYVLMKNFLKDNTPSYLHRHMNIN